MLKFFNGILVLSLVANGLSKRASGAHRAALAGDDATGKAVLSGLVDALGFDPTDGGRALAVEPVVAVYSAAGPPCAVQAALRRRSS